METAIKYEPDAENEIHDVISFRDAGRCCLTHIAQFPADVAIGVVEALAAVVQQAHGISANKTPDGQGIVRAQVFEEGAVYMTSAPYDGFFADRYLMDFFDVRQRDICSRMHIHTGLRFVRMMTGPDTCIRVSALSPFLLTQPRQVRGVVLQQFVDALPDVPDGHHIDRYNAIVPENSWVDMQIPRGTSHQFNAIGPNAVIDTVHPEESIEIFRERATRVNMMAQTVFLTESLPAAATCVTMPEIAKNQNDADDTTTQHG